MLMPSTGAGMVDIVSYELELILKDNKLSLDNEEVLAREIMAMLKSSAIGTPVPKQELAHTIEEMEQPTTVHTAEEKYTGTLIPAACRLAEQLMELEEESRWVVIQGVWVEMICYSASRCRGYLHAKSLGEGRECLTTVWLLWSYLGMETLAYMIQSSDIQEEDEDYSAEKEKEKEEEGASPSQLEGQADQSVEMCPV
ncbi:hypothetical protein ZWY2020_040829 [Hordeum vulgare]|nr:hypothetical protein ZWY2020_040829 [Hordeum vulgare]